ncbi:MAG: hypothetical protein H0T79_10350 [Deltaproteobacteria bacterium]|nr:hypothetical protein [Deltaproteobacteria bacterium]
MARWLIVLFVTLGCSGAERVPPAETNVELVARGALPHRELRYRVAKGTTTTIEVGVDATIIGRDAPTITTAMSFVGENVQPDGRMNLRSTVLSTRAKQPDGQMVPAELTKVFDGIMITATLSPVGTLTDAKVDLAGKDLPEQVNAQLQTLTKSFDQVAMVLPNGPVGVGAQWKTRKTIEQNKVTMTAVTMITLTAIEGDKLTFTRTSEITGPDQTVKEGEVSVSLKNISGSGSAKGTIDLAHLATTSESTDEYHAEIFDQSAPTKTEKLVVKMSMTITPKP